MAKGSPMQGHHTEPLIPEKILRFMNALPTTGDTVEWILQFRAALGELLGDVDRVVVQINQNGSILDPESYRPGMDVSMVGYSGDDRSIELVSDIRNKDVAPAATLIATFKRLGFPMSDYQTPLSYDYYLAGRAYIATLVLMRKRGRPRISEKTLSTLQALEPFLLFAFSGVIARHYRVKPVDITFARVIERVKHEAKLSWREGQVLVFHLMGFSYAEIAQRLFISEHTVAKHVKSAHQKTGCASFLELFAPYFQESFPES